MTTCKNCNASIGFFTLKSGSQIPVDAVPVEVIEDDSQGGSNFAGYTPDGVKVYGWPIPRGKEREMRDYAASQLKEVVRVWRPHFQSCVPPGREDGVLEVLREADEKRARERAEDEKQGKLWDKEK